ncbi:TPA: glycosyltransferase family 1 protein [Vibrio vulnificus]|nr:glycosyltransferase family 1 protein [Vibrio vulnificus]
MTIKDELKKIKFIYNINAIVKAYKTKKKYKEIVRYYKGKKHHDIVFSPRETSNVFYFGGDEYQDKSGFLQGLEKNFEVEVFTQECGKYGQYPRKDKFCRKKNTERLAQLLKNAEEKNNIPDLLLMQTWAWAIDVEELIRLKNKYGFFIANIGMDDRHSYTDLGCWDRGTYGLIPALDFVLTCAPECTEWFEKEGIKAFYFPEASHPDFYYPDPNIDKIYDVGFVGAKYGLREKLVNQLEKDGIKVTCYGNGWPNGRLPLSDTNKFFNQCKILLGVGTIGHTTDFYALKLRDFDATMAGCVYVTHDNPDLHDLFEPDREIVLASNIKEFSEKVAMLLCNENLQAEIRVTARKRAERYHNYEVRFAKLKKVLNGEIDEIF